MEIHEVLNSLDENSIAELAKLAINKIKRNEKHEVLKDDFSVFEQFNDTEQSDFNRLLLGIIAVQDNEIGNFINKKIMKMAIATENRASPIAVDIIEVAAILIPLIQSKIQIKWTKKGKLEINVGYGGTNLSNIIEKLLSPIEILASKIKKLSIGNINMESEEKTEEKL